MPVNLLNLERKPERGFKVAFEEGLGQSLAALFPNLVGTAAGQVGRRFLIDQPLQEQRLEAQRELALEQQSRLFQQQKSIEDANRRQRNEEAAYKDFVGATLAVAPLLTEKVKTQQALVVRPLTSSAQYGSGAAGIDLRRGGDLGSTLKLVADVDKKAKESVDEQFESGAAKIQSEDLSAEEKQAALQLLRDGKRQSDEIHKRKMDLLSKRVRIGGSAQRHVPGAAEAAVRLDAAIEKADLEWASVVLRSHMDLAMARGVPFDKIAVGHRVLQQEIRRRLGEQAATKAGEPAIQTDTRTKKTSKERLRKGSAKPVQTKEEKAALAVPPEQDVVPKDTGRHPSFQFARRQASEFAESAVDIDVQKFEKARSEEAGKKLEATLRVHQEQFKAAATLLGINPVTLTNAVAVEYRGRQGDPRPQSSETLRAISVAALKELKSRGKGKLEPATVKAAADQIEAALRQPKVQSALREVLGESQVFDGALQPAAYKTQVGNTVAAVLVEYAGTSYPILSPVEQKDVARQMAAAATKIYPSLLREWKRQSARAPYSPEKFDRYVEGRIASAAYDALRLRLGK